MIVTILTLVIYGIWQYVFIVIEDGLTVDGFIMSLIFTIVSWGIIYAIKEIKWRVNNGVDVFANLETDQEKVKSHMLFIMQNNGVEENLKELNEIFRNYPQWDLSKWEVFRAWYKAQIDYMSEFPEIYHMTMTGTGKPYSKEEDPLYDPGAPDWEQFDSPRHYDDDDDDDDFDDFEDGGRNFKKAAEDGFSMGIGLGAAANFVNN